MFSYCFRPRREIFHPVKDGWNDICRRNAITRFRNLSMRKILPQVEGRPDSDPGGGQAALHADSPSPVERAPGKIENHGTKKRGERASALRLLE
ncbi:hypothetical protein AB395_0000383 [Sinorhizobium fredii CCBAU 45436]|nr:hypothetical protein SF83666_c03610 [Sinorhizobium fredii CCBAU 83666]AWI56064.1 hypothetical protein AB395_0000383 [Sinorhizobium fredii CCBAU 45436]AWM23690.1 hypothetical protein AOX55_0000410 [Sinorhizobium fredii CCBAU 25509]